MVEKNESERKWEKVEEGGEGACGWMWWGVNLER